MGSEIEREAGAEADAAAAPESEAGAAPESSDAAPAPAAAGAAAAELDALAALGAERDQLQDRYLRLAAEFDNFRKRTAREWREHRERAAAEVLHEMLELADNLERALGAPEDDGGAALRKGVDLILQQLQAKLRRFGVEAMDTGDRAFDPTRHEAVLVVDAEGVVGSHEIVDVVQRGYTLHGEVLRPARVTVAR